MESLIGEMLDGRILLDEAITEFEKIYIEEALARNSDHLSRTATALGIHRNTLSKRVAAYNGRLTAKPVNKKRTPTKKSTRRSATRKTTRKR